MKRCVPEQKLGWVTAPRVSNCHHAKMVYVVSKEGGYVTANCKICGGEPDQGTPVALEEFKGLRLDYPCPNCLNKMVQGMVPDSSGIERNYGFRCTNDSCGTYIWFADVLHGWQDI